MSIASAIEVLQPEEYCRVLTFLHDTGALDGLQRVSALLADAQALDEEHETDVMVCIQAVLSMLRHWHHHLYTHHSLI